MTTPSEERLPEASEMPGQASSSARILSFERPRSDLQRAIQQRAQEAITRDQEREREVRRPQPLRTLIILAVATIPVVLLFGAVDSFVRAMHGAYERYFSEPPTPPPPSVQAVEPVPQSSEPGVVLLQPYEIAPATKPVPSPGPSPQPGQ
jgi:hypothetical protein